MFVKIGRTLLNTENILSVHWFSDHAMRIIVAGNYDHEFSGERAWGVYLALQTHQQNADDLPYLRALTCPHGHDWQPAVKGHHIMECARCGHTEAAHPIDTSELGRIARMAYVNPNNVSQDDHEYVTGTGLYAPGAITPDEFRLRLDASVDALVQAIERDEVGR